MHSTNYYGPFWSKRNLTAFFISDRLKKITVSLAGAVTFLYNVLFLNQHRHIDRQIQNPVLIFKIFCINDISVFHFQLVFLNQIIK